MKPEVSIVISTYSRSEMLARALEVFRIPRWRIRHASAGLVRTIKGRLRLASPALAFQGELRLWDLAGYINGRLFRKA
ncbi:MAG: hypothetical protein ACJ74Z_18225 [Bryobacteraceae bacterium]